MRVEADSTSTSFRNQTDSHDVDNETAAAANALREGIKAAQSGDRAKAREALLRASELDPRSESAWLWLSSISEYPEELLVFLNNVLDINPLNARANEWMKATKGLLARTFVQRGIDAADSGQTEYAAQCFDQALEHDQANTAAWFWLANLSDSPEGKISFLEKVLELDPANETARTAYKTAKSEINRSLLAEARSAAVAGRKTDANELLDAFILENPESEEGWILRSHLADGFAEKIAAFEKVVAINPENMTARSGIESLRAIMDMVAPLPELHAVTEDADPIESISTENTAYALEQERIHDTVVQDKNPTQELEFPAAAEELRSRSELEPQNSDAGVDWSMNTVAFTFDFPGGVRSADDEPVSAGETFEFAVNDESFSDTVCDDTLIESSTGFASEAAQDLEESDADDIHTTFVPEAVPESTVQFRPDFEPVLEEYKPDPSTFGDTFTFVAVQPEEVGTSMVNEATMCPFCNEQNVGQAFTCVGCLATLTLADLEMLLANTHADRTILQAFVDRMEAERKITEFGEAELTTLGLGHLNLRNLREGHAYLHEASQMNPDNVVLAGQVNSLLIRLEEISEQAAAVEAKPKGRLILVVDDSPTVRKLISGKLAKCGHDVHCAADGVEAIELMNAVVPDLVLLDITMPRMDGYQVCKTIRTTESTKDVPVVMISGKDGFFDKVRGRMAGTTGYITKPFGPETLMKAVETYLNGEAL